MIHNPNMIKKQKIPTVIAMMEKILWNAGEPESLVEK